MMATVKVVMVVVIIHPKMIMKIAVLDYKFQQDRTYNISFISCLMSVSHDTSRPLISVNARIVNLKNDY